MANFKAHLSFGLLLGIASVAAATTYSLATDNSFLSVVFFAIIIGSFLPDLDSDGGTPFKLVINTFSFLAAVLSFLYLKQTAESNINWLIGLPVGVFFTIRFLVGGILKKFTHHRGIFHSVPAMLIAALASLLLARNLDFSKPESFYLALSVGIGFLGHLLLDELKSATGLHGIMLKPDKSLGSALKFTSHSKIITITVYLILVGLVYYTLPVLSNYEKYLKTQLK